MSWQTQGIVVSPDAGVTLADTGAIALSTTLALCVVISSQYARRVTMVLRSALNDADVATQRIQVGSDDPVVIAGIPGMAIGLNQRVIIRTENAVVGDVQASIIW